MEGVFDALSHLVSVFAEITNQVTNACFEENFSDFASFAHARRFSLLRALDHTLLLDQLCSQFLLYADKTKTTEIWNAMADRGCDARKLCVFAWYLIERGQQTDIGIDDRKIGLIGCRLYFSLCCLSGSQAYKIFNDYIFQRALEGMNSIRRLLSSDGHLENNRKAAAAKLKTKTKKPFDSINTRMELTSSEQISVEDKSEFKEILFDALDPIFVFLSKVSLSSSQQSSISFTVFLQQLMHIDFSEKTSLLECKYLSDFQRLQNFSDRSFALMHRFLNGDRHACSLIVYGRIVMPRLLFWTLENAVLPTNAHPPKILTVYKNTMLRFIKIRIEKGSKEELSAILLTLKNLCFRCPDRSDYRSKVSSCVVEALAFLPDGYIQKFASFLWLIGFSPKIAVRSFAIEVSLLFLQQYGHILEKCDGRENSVALKTVKEELEDEKQIVATDSNGELMEVDEINEDAGKNEQNTQKKNRRKKSERNSLMGKNNLQSGIFIFLLRSCNDKSPLIRSRALTQISVLLDDASMRSKLLNVPETAVCVGNGENGENADNFLGFPMLLSIMVTRCTDARVSTRKASIIALEAIFPSLNDLEQKEVLPKFKQCCRDPSLLVRRQAAESLSRLLMLLGSQSDFLDNFWLSSVLPLINDREQSVAQLTARLVQDTLISPILEGIGVTAWRVLRAIEQEINHRRLLLRSLLHQAKEGELTEQVVAMLLRNCNDLENVNIVWMLLNFLSDVFKIDVAPVIHFWYTLDVSDDDNLIGYVAEVIARCGERISERDRNQLIQNISMKLTEFCVSECHIVHVYYAFSRLCNAVGDNASGVEQLLEFNRHLIENSLKILHSIIFRSVNFADEIQLSQENNKAAQLLVRIVSSLGEAIQYSPTLLSTYPKIFDLMQLIMASDVIHQQLTQTGTLINTMQTRPSTQCTGMTAFVKHEPQKAGTSEATAYDESRNKVNKVGRSCIVSSKGNQEISVETQEPCASQPTSHGSGPTFIGQYAVNMEVLSPAVRAQAVLTIGKMCLQDEKLAKKCVPVFSRQLLVNSSHLVRSNIVGVICDLCKRYTLLVDRHSAILASCLKDPSTLVRKQTLMLLTHLIKEQFVRWEGQIMYRFVSTILDRNKEIREYAEMCLNDVLLVQFPNMFVNHFLECIFYFNAVTHGSWLAANNALEEDAMERKELKCSLYGPAFKNARMTLYKFMIKTFHDENKFTIGMRIGQEVYSAIVDNVLDIRDRRVKALLEDCYEIMCCSEIKLSMALGRRSSNELDYDDDEPPSNVQEAAKKVVTQAFRKGIIDAILPHVIRLKYYLQEKRLPELEFGSIRVLRELCKDHREQLDEFLASDKQLKAEIKFDLEKLEEKEKRVKNAKDNVSMGGKSFVKIRKVSFAPNQAVLTMRTIDTRERKMAIEDDAANEKQTFGGSQEHEGIGISVTSQLRGMVANHASVTHIYEKEMSKTVEMEVDNDDDDKEYRDEFRHPLVSPREQGVSRATDETAEQVRKMRIEQTYGECELAARAVSTPEHKLGELTFGLGDEMSAIEIATPKPRLTRTVRKANVAPIPEADDESS